jgi:hypothetical protein
MKEQQIIFVTDPVPTQENIDTCVASRNRLNSRRSVIRKTVHNFILERGAYGATCDEVEIALQLRHQTASCFIRFLTKDGFLEGTIERRKTRAGRFAIVWRSTRKQLFS